MHPIISVTLYAGQQLVLEGLQRWVHRPCKELESRRQRASLQALAMLLVKTTATGMLAAVLDAAIEYRSRALLAAAAEGEGEAGTPPRGAMLGMISRPGVAAWKARLLQAIDEMERRAEQYGLGPTSRPKPESEVDKGKGAVLASELDSVASGPEQEALLSRTVQQLQQLMRQSAGQPESLEEDQVQFQLDSLLDSLLGSAGRPDAEEAGARPAPCTCTSPTPEEVPGAPAQACGEEGSRPPPPHPEGCHICMDAAVRVKVAGCGHSLCFGCARRLCSTREHVVPACPFCRQPIEGFEAVAH